MTIVNRLSREAVKEQYLRMFNRRMSEIRKDIYDYLVSTGRFKITPEQWLAILEEEKKNVSKPT